MRQIKFRAWDGNKMYLPGDSFTDAIVIRYRQDGSIEFISVGESDFGDVFGFGWMNVPGIPPPAVMQFTGLLDRDKKEIWEGDILSFYRGPNMAVVYTESQACFMLIRTDSLNEMPFNTLYMFNHEGKVIGNIYQNP